MKCLDERLDGAMCYKCPCYHFTQDYFGEGDEYCGISRYYMDLRWYCFLPKFLKKKMAKRAFYKEMENWRKAAKELEENEFEFD